MLAHVAYTTGQVHALPACACPGDCTAPSGTHPRVTGRSEGAAATTRTRRHSTSGTQPGGGTCPSAFVSQEPEGAGQVPVAVQLAAGRSPALWGHHGLAALAPLLHAGTSGSDSEPVTPWKHCSCRASKASARSMHAESGWPQGDRSCACGRGHGSGHILPYSCESALTSSQGPACLMRGRPRAHCAAAMGATGKPFSASSMAGCSTCRPPHAHVTDRGAECSGSGQAMYRGRSWSCSQMA